MSDKHYTYSVDPAIVHPTNPDQSPITGSGTKAEVETRLGTLALTGVEFDLDKGAIFAQVGGKEVRIGTIKEAQFAP